MAPHKFISPFEVRLAAMMVLIMKRRKKYKDQMVFNDMTAVSTSLNSVGRFESHY
jgi:hypothetical protein